MWPVATDVVTWPVFLLVMFVNSGPRRNGRTDQDTDCRIDLDWHKEPCIRCSPDPRRKDKFCGVAGPIEIHCESLLWRMQQKN